MSNWGSLTSAEQTLFATYQGLVTTDPTIEVVIGGISDLRGLVLYCYTDRGVEAERGLGFVSIGRAYLVIDNTGGILFDDGESKVAENADIRIWMGYKGLNVPVFTGTVRRVIPVMDREAVIVHGADRMLRMFYEYVDGSVDPDDTPKLIAEQFCQDVGAPSILGTKGSGAGVAGEIIEEYNTPTFDYMRMVSALQNVQNSIFHAAVFDEEGALQMYQRDRSNPVSWTYTEKTAKPVEWMAASNIMNHVRVEYDERFFVHESNQQSIDDNGKAAHLRRVLISNSETVSERLYGTGTEELDNDREAFRITSGVTATSIDSLHLSMGQSGSASGNITVKIYRESGGVPNLLLATSQLKASGGLWPDVFAWEPFYFETPAEISPNTNYWVEIDTSGVSGGTVYLRINRADATALYAYFSSGWTTEDDKQPVHKIRASRMARRAARDIVSFYKDEKDIVRVTSSVGVPQFSLFDDIGIDVSVATMSGAGRYVLERVEHTFSPEGFTTRHTARAVATGKAKTDVTHYVYKIYADLDGDSQYFYRTDADFPESGITGASDFTIVAWIKPGILTGWPTIVSKWNTTGSKTMYWFGIDNNGELNFYASDDGAGGPARTTTAANLVVGQWYHVAVTYDASAGSCVFYVNGAVVADDGIGLDTSIADLAPDFRVGNDGDGFLFRGGIRNVALYNAIVSGVDILAAAEDWNYDHSGEANIIGCWLFDDAPDAAFIDNGQGDAGRDLIPYDGGDVAFATLRSTDDL